MAKKIRLIEDGFDLGYEEACASAACPGSCSFCLWAAFMAKVSPFARNWVYCPTCGLRLDAQVTA